MKESRKKNGCIMYCFSALFRNFVRGRDYVDERILQIEKKSPVILGFHLSNLVENARCMSKRVHFGDLLSLLGL